MEKTDFRLTVVKSGFWGKKSTKESSGSLNKYKTFSVTHCHPFCHSWGAPLSLLMSPQFYEDDIDFKGELLE